MTGSLVEDDGIQKSVSSSSSSFSLILDEGDGVEVVDARVTTDNERHAKWDYSLTYSNH